ncbi:Der GTPase-activating protein YihI [Vibrio rhizosphaerae]|uniref:Der GTPase-activating protein YihI n=1 Tax=Vibrio rhizosphaerae TaxID=398736 RepID=A0ABU4IPG9_9VIBR|nr:Der GTPase-activating protein YihI [Vibrio rhizosphaerae]MDW6091305.1 Der GTPase-activating protein YihI [Vibrio rhizosphaerae]
MSRKKKVRSSGNTDVVVVRQRSQTDIEGRLRKKLKKRKGLKTGSRHSEESGSTRRLSASTAQDPRLGSKKKIPLVVETQPKVVAEKRQEQAEQELALLENDAQLHALLARLDRGEKLGAGLQQYVDEKLNRIEQLMKQLGLFDEEEDDAVSSESPAMKSKQSASDDELLEKFTGFDPDDFQQ